jgi:zeaxanthin glucosyltransferase
VAERHGIPYATSVTTSAELTDPLSTMPKVDAWLKGRFASLREQFGDVERGDDPRFSPHGIIAFTGRALLGDAPLPWDGVHLVGPAIAPRASQYDFPYEELDPERRKVLVTLGTANADAGERFLGEALAALDALGETVQGIVVDPGGLLDGQSHPGVLIREYVPQLDLLPHLDAVVCHGGHNTVCEALAQGLPLVVAPVRDDHPLVADQVVAAGAGLRVKFGRIRAAALAEAVDAALHDPGLRKGAALVKASFERAGGAPAAAAAVEELCRPTS